MRIEPTVPYSLSAVDGAPREPDAPSVDLIEADGPLAGVTVLDLSTVGPAARCTRLLADYGASVVKVGPVPGRGPAPIVPPYFAYSGSRRMRRVCIDLRDDQGRQAFLALADAADVVVESFRPGVMDRLGLGYRDVSARNPGVVYCSTSGYGQSGPRAGWAGHDLDYLAVGGFLASSGPGEGGTPPLPGATVADAAAGGLHAALAVACALAARPRRGRGCHLDVSVADGVLWLMGLQVDEHLATGAEPGPGHDILTGRYACYATYRCADGRYLAVAAIEAKFFANLCRELGLEAWAGRQLDDDAQDELRAALAEAFARRPRDEWVAALAAADTCVAPVRTVAETAADEQYLARGAFVDAHRPGHPGTFRQVGAVLAGMAPLPEVVELPGSESEADALLAAAGVDAGRRRVWRDAGVVA